MDHRQLPDLLASGEVYLATPLWAEPFGLATVEAMAREIGGTGAVLGNHVIVAHDDGTFAAYAHLRRGSAIALGGSVVAGDVIGRVGNTGNTSEPHLHVQLMDHAAPTAAAGIPMRWPDVVTDPDEQKAIYEEQIAPGLVDGNAIFFAQYGQRVLPSSAASGSSVVMRPLVVPVIRRAE